MLDNLKLETQLSDLICCGFNFLFFKNLHGCVETGNEQLPNVVADLLEASV